MGFRLSLLILSFFISMAALVPFINLLYKLKFQRKKQETKDAFHKPTPIFDKLHKLKAGTPVGGGLLIIVITTLLFLFSFVLQYYFWIPMTSVYKNIPSEVKILLFTFISFGLLGLYDDIRKMFFTDNDTFFGLRLRHKLIFEIILAGIISYWIFAELKVSIIHIPIIGVFEIGWLYIPFATFVILAFSNAFNITDGLDGLATGLLMIALAAFWVVASSILDTPISNFIAIWIGVLIAFLYFNIFPARIILGDVGALSFGATMAVIGLMTGKVFSLVIIGGFFVAEVTSSLIQLLSKKYAGKKVFKVAPFHLLLQNAGWPESKVVMRSWIIGIILAIFGLWIAFVK